MITPHWGGCSECWLLVLCFPFYSFDNWLRNLRSMGVERRGCSPPFSILPPHGLYQYCYSSRHWIPQPLQPPWTYLGLMGEASLRSGEGWEQKRQGRKSGALQGKLTRDSIHQQQLKDDHCIPGFIIFVDFTSVLTTNHLTRGLGRIPRQSKKCWVIIRCSNNSCA